MNYEMLREILAARRNTFLFLVFLALLNLVMTLYLSGWQRPELAKAQNEWFAKREALKSGQSAGAAALYENGVRDLAEFRKRLIPKREFPRFLNQLYDTCRSNSVEIKTTSYKPTPVKEAEGMFSYAISMTVTGKYAGIKSFLADLSRYREMVTLDTVTLGNASKTEEDVALQLNLTAYLKTEGA